MRRLSYALGTAILVSACVDNAQSEAASEQAPITHERPFADKPFDTTAVADFESPWAMTFLPDGHMLVTEKAGQLLLLSGDGKERSVVAGIPRVNSANQGGLLDVVLAPDFPTSRRVYFSFSEAGPGGNGVALGRGMLVVRQVMCIRAPCPPQAALENVEVIFRASPYLHGDGQYSGRIAFSPDGRYLFFTDGDLQKMKPAQDHKSTLGKVLRLTLDGRPAPGNPLAARGFNPAIWSYGHRNLLGLAFDAQGRLWEHENGPMGGDELNLILPGRNYGWPIVSNGDNYDGTKIPDHPTRPEFEAPKVSWNPVIAPAGLIFYSGALFPQWRGSAFIGGMASKSLVRVVFDGDKAHEAERFDMGERIREVEQGPEGALYLLEDGRMGAQGRLLKLTPKP